MISPPSHLVQTDKSSAADIVFLQKFYTFLSGIYGVHHYVVKSTTGCWYGNIKLFIYTTEVALAISSYRIKYQIHKQCKYDKGMWGLWYEPRHEKTCFMLYANNKDADQHLCCSLLTWYITYSCYIQNFKTLASEAEQTRLPKWP